MMRQASTIGRCLTSAFLCSRQNSPAFVQSTAGRRPMTTMKAANLVNTVDTNISIDWDDRISLQKTWNNTEKGWKVDVEWNMTPYGVGLFAAQTIGAGTTLRTGVIGVNLLQFSTLDEIETFCRKGNDYNGRVRYVSDYLWGFTTKGTNERGYTEASEQDERHRFYGCWLPGNGLNHSLEPNTVYRTSDVGIDLVALTDIERGEELYDDYRRHGSAPSWLRDFAKDNDKTLNFAECNDFVDPDKID